MPAARQLETAEDVASARLGVGQSPGGEPDGGRLVGARCDLGQLEHVAGGDPVADVVREHVVVVPVSIGMPRSRSSSLSRSNISSEGLVASGPRTLGTISRIRSLVT